MNGPFTPDLANPISKLGEEAKKNNWPLDVKVFVIEIFQACMSLLGIKSEKSSVL